MKKSWLKSRSNVGGSFFACCFSYSSRLEMIGCGYLAIPSGLNKQSKKKIFLFRPFSTSLPRRSDGGWGDQFSMQPNPCCEDVIEQQGPLFVEGYLHIYEDFMDNNDPYYYMEGKKYSQ